GLGKALSTTYQHGPEETAQLLKQYDIPWIDPDLYLESLHGFEDRKQTIGRTLNNIITNRGTSSPTLTFYKSHGAVDNTP
ncbi:MAG TPA: hypothetical protein VD947_01020, partial [Patescibacteria group bacterium]|nr:hypothetical protein [Patescibacteria group bacterium]